MRTSYFNCNYIFLRIYSESAMSIISECGYMVVTLYQLVLQYNNIFKKHRGKWGKGKRKISSVSQGVDIVNMVIFRYYSYFRG